MVDQNQFPILSSINSLRETYYARANQFETLPGAAPRSVAKRTGYWLAHKGLSVISLAANAAGVCVGVAGMAASACTLGAFKVAAFAVTGGKVEFKFKTGFLWFANRAVSSAGQILQNIGEIALDIGRLGIEAFKKVKWLLTALKLTRIFVYINHFVKFLGERLQDGFQKAYATEAAAPNSDQQILPQALADLNGITDERSYRTQSRSALDWTVHKALSVVNIPLNTAFAAVSGALFVAGLVGFVAKGVLATVTTISLPVPTYMGHTAAMCGRSFTNALSNTADVGVDFAIALYRISERLHITEFIATVADLVAYIPRAICT